jgi:hypothetical protein
LHKATVRGKDPKSALDIGLRSSIERLFKDFIRDEELTGIAYVDELEDPLRENFPMLLVRGIGSGLHRGVIKFFRDKGLDKYLDIYDVIIARHDETFLYYPIKPEYEDLFKGMNLHWRSLDESISFERGKDPKTVMGIGDRGVLLNAFAEIDRRKDDIWGLESFTLRKDSVSINSRYRTEGITWVNDLLKDLGIRHFFERKVEKGQHADGVVFDLTFKPQYMGMINPQDEWGIEYNIYRGWETWRRAEDFNESARFERGKDPKESMKVGLESRTLPVTSITDPNYFEYNDKEVSLIFYQLAGGAKYIPGNKILFNYVIDELDGLELESSYSLDELQISKDYDFIRFDGERYPIEKNKGYLKYIGESVKFERGKDPRDAMTIGKAAMVKDMIEKQAKTLSSNFPLFSGSLLDSFKEWSYEETKVKGYDAYQIEVVHPHGEVEYMILVPGLFLTSLFNNPRIARDQAEFNLHGSVI